MKNGNFIIGKYFINPNTSVKDFKNIDFDITVLDDNYKVYRFKEKQDIGNMTFFVSFVVIDNIIKRIRLSNADEKYRVKGYSDMTNEKLKILRKSHDDFLNKYLGNPNKEGLTGIQYNFNWGTITSYLYIQDGSCGIEIKYI